MDVLFLKKDIHLQRFQHTDGFKERHGITRKAGDGFREYHIHLNVVYDTK